MTADGEKAGKGLVEGDAPEKADDGCAYWPEAISVLEGLPVRPPRRTFNIGGNDGPDECQAEVPSSTG